MKRNDTFIIIRFKLKTAKRFQEFSKKHFKTYTKSMTSMLDFLLYNKLSSKEKFGPTGRTIEQALKKRLNAIIAVIRDIEKNKANPTLALLQSLFEETEPKKKPLILEKENQGLEKEEMEHIFNQYGDEISAEEVIRKIDGNTAKLEKTEPRFYTLTVSPLKYELNRLENSSEDLKRYIWELMKDFMLLLLTGRSMDGR